MFKKYYLRSKKNSFTKIVKNYRFCSYSTFVLIERCSCFFKITNYILMYFMKGPISTRSFKNLAPKIYKRQAGKETGSDVEVDSGQRDRVQGPRSKGQGAGSKVQGATGVG